MSGIMVEQLGKTFGRHAALRNVSFAVKQGDIAALLGPSGCGKSTTLRCIAGLEHPSTGRIVIGDKVVFSSSPYVMLPPEKRRVGLVFQSYALWPHMTVWQNVAYGLEVKGMQRADVAERVARVLSLTGLSGIERRYPATLSGGQQQRVALARSLITEPEVLLLDEPLSNLDAKLREHLRSELQVLIKNLGLTAVYVTHDAGEALLLADHLVVMMDGEVVETGSPRMLYDRPRTVATFQFLGSANLLEVRVVGESDRGVRVATDSGLILELTHHGRQGFPERPFFVGIRPERISIFAGGIAAAATSNVVEGEIERVSFMGNVTYYDVRCSGHNLRVQASTAEYKPGDRIHLYLPPDWLIPFIHKPLLRGYPYAD